MEIPERLLQKARQRRAAVFDHEAQAILAELQALSPRPRSARHKPAAEAEVVVKGPGAIDLAGEARSALEARESHLYPGYIEMGEAKAILAEYLAKMADYWN